ncbi:MAG: putative spermidine/putrescine transport system substrate-binding protein [Thermomicrobiales bacterium]|jgi:putative spermidine/putrescine transport system substrate-binding protein|nr:putative spermidine/putrescine transport system substrate-binding protein [Thermomicrobiales bacterium]
MAGGVTVGIGACGGDGKGEVPGPTATAEPSPTPELSPTPTQDVIASPVAGYSDPTKWQGRTLTVAAWGGEYQDAQEEAFFDPFAEATGVKIQIKRADLGELRSQVEDEGVAWDVVTVPMEDVLDLAHGQYLEPINYQVVDRIALFDEVALQYGVGAAFYSTVMVYPAGSSNAPQDWVDFWDVPPLGLDEAPEPENARSLRRSPIGTLEFALLADGVMPDALYPLDVERAFASLDRIRNHVIVWWQEGKEPIQLVASGEAGMASAWYARLWQLDLADTVRVQWFGGMLSTDAWVIPRGAPNADIAMDFINFATRAVPSANFARLVPFGPVNKDAFGLLRSDRAAVLPSAAANKAVQFVLNWNYWADNREALTERFEEWLAVTPEETASPSAGDAEV